MPPRNPGQGTASGKTEAVQRILEEVKEQVPRYAARRRAQGSSWEAIGRETGLEARKLRAIIGERWPYS